MFAKIAAGVLLLITLIVVGVLSAISWIAVGAAVAAVCDHYGNRALFAPLIGLLIVAIQVSRHTGSYVAIGVFLYVALLFGTRPVF